MCIAYLLIGSNLGERAKFIAQANEFIQQRCGKIMGQSALYETAPWGLLAQPAFLNQAISVETTLEPEQLMQVLLAIENDMGRTRTIQYGPRTIDLDILLINQHVLDTPLLKLPHPALPERRFALIPLAEIAPGLVHPIFNKTVLELLTLCQDQSDVQKKMD